MIYLLAGIMVDLVVGDPAFITHPVVIMGKLINFIENILEKLNLNRTGKIIGGIFLVMMVGMITYGTVFLILNISLKINIYFFMMVKVWLISTTIAIKGLAQAGKAVYFQLEKDNLERARKEVGKIVGRDTEKMQEKDIIRAVVETVAENTSDGVTAPIFYYLVGGLPLAMTYKAVNTMDSMLGYKNKKYKYLGRGAARLDDLANFIPARVTALAICGAAWVMGKSGRNGLKTIIRDARSHPSWNAGFPEAAVAGSLEIRLGGENYYGGTAEFRAYMGKKIKEIEIEDIENSIKIMYVTVVITLFFLFLIYYFV